MRTDDLTGKNELALNPALFPRFEDPSDSSGDFALGLDEEVMFDWSSSITIDDYDDSEAAIPDGFHE